LIHKEFLAGDPAENQAKIAVQNRKRVTGLEPATFSLGS
jgi:hypothetical protein